MAPYATPARSLSQSSEHTRHDITWDPYDSHFQPAPQALANAAATSTARSIGLQSPAQTRSGLQAYPVIVQGQTDTVGYHAVVTPTRSSNVGSITVPVSIALDTIMSGLNRPTSTATSPITSNQATQMTTLLPHSTPLSVMPTSSFATLTSPDKSSSTSSVHNHSISALSPPAVTSGPPNDNKRSFTLNSPEIMAAVAGAGVLLLVALVVTYRLCHSRRRAARKNISKPIPHAVFEADSPMFGAGEKHASADMDKATWTWTTYSLPYQETPSAPSSAETSWDEKSNYPVHASTLTNTTPESHLPMGALATDLPLDASSNNPSSISTSLLAQLPPYLEQCPPSIPSPATIYPLASTDNLNERRNTRLSYMSMQSSAYGGCTTSPSLPAPELPIAIPTRPVPRSSSSTSNRAKIKTPYRIGHARQPSTSTVKMYMPNRSTYTLLPLPSLYIPDTASGLDAMWPLSTESPSVRSEDPSRVIGNLSTEQNREQLRKIAVQSVEDTSAALEQRRWQRQQQARSLTNVTEAVGALMLADHDAPPTPVLDGRFVHGNTAHSSVPRQTPKRPMKTGDRPPRVPSPPPLPSLEQMALAEHDPNYRSPTYSLYACYDSETR